VDLQLAYCPNVDAWTFHFQDAHLRNANALVQWRALAERELAKLKGRRALLLVCLDDMSVEAHLLTHHGKAVRELMGKHALAVFRYGGTLRTTTAMRLAAMRCGFASRIHATREAAIEALNEWRAKWDVVAPCAPST
jgi:hypothetical protein